jgi:ankyrin repeat protein
MQLLVNAGADVGAVNEREETALHIAATSGDNRAVAFLLKHGADVEARDSTGQTPLHAAEDANSGDCVRELLQAGADASPQNATGATPLHWAVSLGRMDLVRILIEGGADVNAPNKHGSTPLHFAAGGLSGGPATLALLKAGAKRDARDREGIAPLHTAASRGEVGALHVLVDWGADHAARTHAGPAREPLTALHYAEANGCDDAAALLRAVATRRARQVALVMAANRRLGAACWLRSLEPEVLRMIAQQVA